MDANHLDQVGKSSPETSSDSSTPPNSPDTNEIFGEPIVHPRVGDEYQVEIPHILSESELLYLMVNPADPQGINDPALSFVMGLAVPVILISNQVNQVRTENIEARNEPLESVNIAMEQTSSHEKEPTVTVDARDMFYIVPGMSTDSLSDFEGDCFLLGLHIFGKNLIQVGRFMDNKNMGQVLSFYYGCFYGSPAYCKWAESRKTRKRKSVIGPRILTGYRQQELFSRLLPHLSDESKTTLFEASRGFADGRTSLDDYVSTLKALVGIHALVEAVGIGKGKDDLTTLVIDSSRNNHMFTHRPEIPSGKACSSLTCPEIVKYLTGDFRLSKARSNDLFWEAVWPRLLARGWHSEQPRSDNYAGSKNCLVFLMPGIKKFSRRKLSKGEHYFDSVSDVLAKVASEPELLELEADETGPSIIKKENGWGVDINSDDDNGNDHDHDPSDKERHCYLKPRVSTGLSNISKFTIVDTSLALANEDNPSKVRELRSLPLEAKRSGKPKRESQDIFGFLPNDPRISTSTHIKGVLSDNNLVSSKMAADVNTSSDHKQRAIKHQFTRRGKSTVSNCSGQVTKRRKLASFSETDATYVLSLPARAPFRGTSRSIKIKPPRMKEKTPGESLNENCVGSNIFKVKEEIVESHEIIDLNLPQVPLEPEIFYDYKVKVEEGESEVNQHFDVLKSKEKAEEKEELETTLANLVSEPPPVIVATNKECGSNQLPRRQSTRNRPLTTKALEALEIGFLNPVRYNRKRSPSTSQAQKSKRSRQPRSKSNGLPIIGPIVDKKEVVVSNPLGVSPVSCPDAS